MKPDFPERRVDLAQRRNMTKIDDLEERCERRLQDSTSAMLNAVLEEFHWHDGNAREWALMLNVGMRVLALLMVAEPKQEWNLDAVCSGLREHYEFFSRPANKEPLSAPDQK